MAIQLGGPAHFKLNFKKYRLFVRLKLYHEKTPNRQTVVWRDVKMTVTTNHFPKTGVS